jgi:hypothetical protein
VGTGNLRPRKRPRARNSRGLYCIGHIEALSYRGSPRIR